MKTFTTPILILIALISATTQAADWTPLETVQYATQMANSQQQGEKTQIWPGFTMSDHISFMTFDSAKGVYALNYQTPSNDWNIVTANAQKLEFNKQSVFFIENDPLNLKKIPVSWFKLNAQVAQHTRFSGTGLEFLINWVLIKYHRFSRSSKVKRVGFSKEILAQYLNDDILALVYLENEAALQYLASPIQAHLEQLYAAYHARTLLLGEETELSNYENYQMMQNGTADYVSNAIPVVAKTKGAAPLNQLISTTAERSFKEEDLGGIFYWKHASMGSTLLYALDRSGLKSGWKTLLHEGQTSILETLKTKLALTKEKLTARLQEAKAALDFKTRKAESATDIKAFKKAAAVSFEAYHADSGAEICLVDTTASSWSPDKRQTLLNLDKVHTKVDGTFEYFKKGKIDVKATTIQLDYLYLNDDFCFKAPFESELKIDGKSTTLAELISNKRTIEASKFNLTFSDMIKIELKKGKLVLDIIESRSTNTPIPANQIRITAKE